LLTAAEQLGARRFVTQSIIIGYGICDHGDGRVTEDNSFGIPAGDSADAMIGALHSAEAQTFSAPEGIALRYGLFYGGDALQIRTLLKARAIPVAFGGLLGWVHHHDAAAATVAALESGRAGQAYNIVDDQPATWLEVFDAMAEGLGAPRPRRIPRPVLRVIAPWLTRFAFDTNIHVSNEKAKRELGWKPRYKTFREGVKAMATDVAAQTATLQPLAAATRR
jgi:nucleoside-diphosphate-sugar epimerase